MAASFKVTEADRAMLESWLRAPRLAQDLALRARVILASAAGESVRALARRLEVSPNTVAVWRRRYRGEGLAGLRTRPRAGRPRRITAAGERAVVGATLRKPGAATHWSARRLAREVGLSPATAHRIWHKYGLQPHRVETFKFSRDPQFEAKLADVVGLYLDPPERALALCVDEKSQIQALDRTQPALPMWPGLPARMTHDYIRHGTTSLFAALEVASGKVHGRCFKRHTHLEFIAFLESLAKRYPRLELHLICDNYGTHKHPAVREWLAAHRRFHLHFTRPAPRGLIWWSAGSRSLPPRPSVAAASTALPAWSGRSPVGWLTGTTTPSPSAGPNPPPTSNAHSQTLLLFTRRDTSFFADLWTASADYTGLFKAQPYL